MKKSKEYKISMVSSIAALVLLGISIVTGLIPGLIYSIDKICMYLGFAMFGLGMVFFTKSKKKNDDK